MKHLLLAALLLATSALADTPAQISADYRKQAAQALAKVNDTLEKATVPLIAALVKAGDTEGANALREQLAAKTAGEPMMKPQASAFALFKSYDAARTKALEPVQKAAVARIDTMLAGSEGKKLDVVTELGKVRAEIEAGKISQTANFPLVWNYHLSPDGGKIIGVLTLSLDGKWKLFNPKVKPDTESGEWVQLNKNTLELKPSLNEAIWKMTLDKTTAVLDRSDTGTRYLRVPEKLY